MNSEIAIKVENLTKVYPLRHPQKGADGTVTQEHCALRDVSFEIKKGESIGIIGPNGSGKSTLLKILAGITKPTSGKAAIRGKVASILDIGAGFHPELSGRENIFLNGQLHGFSKKEITKKYDEIIAFSEIEQFIDEPVKNYSNGMYLRLAFSIMAHLDFDVYLLDEVLSVGDEAFRKKIFNLIQTWQSEKTLLIITHDIEQITPLMHRLLLVSQKTIESVKIQDQLTTPIHFLVENYIEKHNIQDENFHLEINTTNYKLFIECKRNTSP